MIERTVSAHRIGRALALLLAGASLLAPPAAADPAGSVSGWSFDRLTWSPGGDSLAVEAVEYRLLSGRFEQSAGPVTLLVDIRTGAVSAPPEARAFQILGESDEMLLLGSWGLWQFDVRSGRARQLHVSSPGGGARIYDFAFDTIGRPLFLVGAVGDSIGGLFRVGPGGEPEFVAPFEPGGPDVPRQWTEGARPGARPQVQDARGPRFFTIDGFSGEFHYDGRRLVHTTESGAPAVIADSVEIAWASWPREGGVGLVSVSSLRQSGAGAVYRLRPEQPARRIMDAASPQIAWRSAREALLNDGQGRLHSYDADRDVLHPVPIQAWPAWVGRQNPPGEVPTLRVDRWPLSAPDEASRRALIRKCEKDLRPGRDESPFAALLRSGDGDPEGGIEGLGSFPTPAMAEQVLPTLEKRGLRAHVSVVPVRRLWGIFDSGFVRAGDGAVAFTRRTNEDQPFTEVWFRPPGEALRRLLSTRIGR